MSRLAQSLTVTDCDLLRAQLLQEQGFIFTIAVSRADLASTQSPSLHVLMALCLEDKV
jgi:hypothetical protein